MPSPLPLDGIVARPIEDRPPELRWSRFDGLSGGFAELGSGSCSAAMRVSAQVVKGRAVIIVAHGLFAVRHADRTLTLERGRLGGWKPQGLGAFRRGPCESAPAESSVKDATFVQVAPVPQVAPLLPAAPRTGRAELEFLPAAPEILETPPSPAGRAIGAVIIGFR